MEMAFGNSINPSANKPISFLPSFLLYAFLMDSRSTPGTPPAGARIAPQRKSIESSADLRNNYNEISTFCHNYPEPVFITKNGKGDLAVMSIEAYEELTSRFELYSQIKEGMDDIASGNTRPFSEAMADIRSKRRR